MKRFYFVLIVILSMSTFLFGCSQKEKDMKNNLDIGIDQAQRIEVTSVKDPNSVLAVIDKKEDVNTFIKKLRVNKWNTAEIPSNANKKDIYKLYQKETIKLGDKSNKGEQKLQKVGTITTYKNSSYVSFQTKGLNFNLKVPQDVAEYLSNQSHLK
ncbi:hypothetical protein M3690_26525 [Priestia megaterium]|uniref:hypothetical protein n=1 Tax=Priestia TaxID=2800373 RepID=UPI000BFE3414|nr:MULTISPECIES: hypothetical protein [Priestia]MCM3796836.1 hypothetical protein [Priestia megaterium]PGK19921.1 hypothetical protein CN902_27975 [Priestia megaterium]